MLAPSIRIDREIEGDVGGFVALDQAPCPLRCDGRARPRGLVRQGGVPAVVEGLALQRLEAAFGVQGRATSFDGCSVLACDGLERRHAVNIDSNWRDVQWWIRMDASPAYPTSHPYPCPPPPGVGR